MKRTAKTLVVVAFLAAAFSTQSFAQTCYSKGWQYGIFNGSYSPYGYNPCYGRADGGNFAFGGTMWWDQAGRNGIQSYLGGGRRYTHDLTDSSNRLTANGWYSTNFPSPYPDYDDDNGNGTWEEWEVTVEDSSFPVAYRNYYVIFWATIRSSGYGYVLHTPAISEQLAWTSDKWDTYRYSGTPFWQYYSPTWNGLFEGEGEPKLSGDADLLNRQGDEDPNEEQDERIVLSDPISVGDFQAMVNLDGKTIASFLLAYEVDTEQGIQTVYVGGVPTENELVSLSRADEVLHSAPVELKSVRLKGIVSYSIASDKTQDK